jgi:hypothetical protein
MSLYAASVPHFSRMLTNLQTWLDKAEAHAQAKKFDPLVLLGSRLAPDQLPLMRQIQIACDAAKNGSARLTGKQAPSFPDTEQTLEEIRARVKATLAFLATLTVEDFAGAETRKFPIPNRGGKLALGADHLFEQVIPNFYFHVTTTYAILRHNGVDLGKADYLGPLTLHDA